MQVFSIRAAATDNLAKLAQEFGADWAQEHLVPQACMLPPSTSCSCCDMHSPLTCTAALHGRKPPSSVVVRIGSCVHLSVSLSLPECLTAFLVPASLLNDWTWTCGVGYTQVLTMVNNQHYLYRMTVLVAITSLASVVSHETLYQTILPAVVSCAKDKVILQTHLLCCQAGIKHQG